MYTLTVLAFGIPLDGYYTVSGRGFMALWMLNWCTMGACGLVMEAVFTVVGMQWAPFGLNIWLIANVSACFSSFEVMVGFYRYGYAMPFYHCVSPFSFPDPISVAHLYGRSTESWRADDGDADSSYQDHCVWHKKSFRSELWRSCFLDGARLVWYVFEHGMAGKEGEEDWYPSSALDTGRVLQKVLR
jgi:hypothetical protein